MQEANPLSFVSPKRPGSTMATASTANAEASPEVMRLFSSQVMENLLENMLNGVAFCKMIYENDQPVDFWLFRVFRG